MVLVGLAALTLRAVFISRQAGGLDADNVTVGLMARHILEGRQYAFFWGQAYLGSFEAYLAAFYFAVLGSGDIALQLAPFTTTLGFLASACRLAWDLGGARVAGLTLALLALGSLDVTLWTITPRGGYPAMVALGTLVLLLATRLTGRPGPAETRRWIVLGLAAGVGLWTHLLIGVYFVAVAGHLVLARRLRLATPGPWWGAAFFLVGSLPLWLHNVTHGFATVALAPPPRGLDPLENIRMALTFNLPKSFGARLLPRPWPLLPWPLVAVVVGVPLIALADRVRVWLRAGWAAGGRPDSVLGLLLASTALAVLLTP